MHGAGAAAAGRVTTAAGRTRPTPSPNWPSSEAQAVRIDRFLHCIRLVRSRTLAQAIIDEGHVRIDGRRVEKPTEEVRLGSVLALPLRAKCAC